MVYVKNASQKQDSIPFLELVAPHQELEAELMNVLRTALRTAGFIGGPMVEEFENAFAEFCHSRHCVGVGSGTDALRFALIAAGVGPGDAVLTVPNTFIATTEAISQAGAQAEFVDIDELSYNMDPQKLHEFLENQCESNANGELRISGSKRRLRAIVPVHLYGQMADMDAILEIAHHYNLVVVEDACQAHGAEYLSRKDGRWHRAGSMGTAAAFSFYPGKNLGACGEAGAVTTNDPAVARQVRMLRDHGQMRKYEHLFEGYNGRLDAVQAGFLTVKLRHLQHWNELRRRVASQYAKLFGVGLDGVVLPSVSSRMKHIYHLYVIRAKERDSLRVHLEKAGISTGIHYPIPLHFQPAYKHLNYAKGSFPIAEQVAGELLSLPMFPHLDDERQRRIVDRVLSLTAVTA